MRRPRIVLVPGFMCDEELWRDQLPALRDIGECHVADITGPASLEEMARGILDAHPDPFCLAGFSLGGYVAQSILRLAPERVERLALIDTSMKADTPLRRAQRDQLSQAAMTPGQFAGMTRNLLRSYVADVNLDDEALAQRILAMTRRLGRDVFIRQNAVLRGDGADVLAAVSCPALVMCGRADAITPPSVHVEMAGLIADARLVVLDDCGHMAPMERPDEVARELAVHFS